MSIFVYIRRFWYVGALLLYFLYSLFILQPSRIGNFALVDDGQVLVQSTEYLKSCITKLDCSLFIDQTFEFGSSRIRPVYWLINNFNYLILNQDVSLHHEFRVYIYGGLMLTLLYMAQKKLRVSTFFIIIGLLLFFTNYSFTENIIRLGTNEPYQIIALLLFYLYYSSKWSSIYRDKKHFLLALIMLLAIVFIKENNVFILPTIFLADLIIHKKRYLRNRILLILSVGLVFLVGLLVTKLLPSEISVNIPTYTTNYITKPTVVINNVLALYNSISNLTAPFLKITFIVGLILIINKKLRSIFMNNDFIFWLLFTIFSFVVLIPWRYVLDRYQLVTIMGVIILTTYILDRFVKFAIHELISKISTHKIFLLFSQALIILTTVNIFSSYFSFNIARSINYSEWFYIFNNYEGDVVSVINKYNSEMLYINAKDSINNWEFLYEIPIHLKYIYEDKPQYKILTSTEIKDNSYILSRSPLDSSVDPNEIKEKGVILEQKDYIVTQIDPVKFRKNFVLHPIKTLLGPPLKTDSHEYSWEVIKI